MKKRKNKGPFPKGFGYTYDGDESLTATVDGITLRAHTERDNDSGPPDKEDDGFWPSLDPKAAGYIGPKSKRTLASQMRRARSWLDAWKADEWDYCGVIVTATFEGVDLVEEYEVASWGLERNHPADPENTYLLEVANNLAGEALHLAREKAAKIVAALKPLIGEEARA